MTVHIHPSIDSGGQAGFRAALPVAPWSANARTASRGQGRHQRAMSPTTTPCRLHQMLEARRGDLLGWVAVVVPRDSGQPCLRTATSFRSSTPRRQSSGTPARSAAPICTARHRETRRIRSTASTSSIPNCSRSRVSAAPGFAGVSYRP